MGSEDEASDFSFVDAEEALELEEDVDDLSRSISESEFKPEVADKSLEVFFASKQMGQGSFPACSTSSLVQKY